MSSTLSLANKCQVLFGTAVLAIFAMALAVPWIRTDTLIRESELEVAQQLAETWLASGLDAPRGGLRAGDVPIPIRFVPLRGSTSPPAGEAPFADAAIARFLADPQARELFEEDRGPQGRIYRYARAVRHADSQASGRAGIASFDSRTVDTVPPETLEGVLLVERASAFAASQLLLNRVFIVVTGLIAVAMAMVAFWFILTQLILSPVRRLRETAEKVQRGDLAIRSRITTGDDFEQLSSAFNLMLDKLQSGQERLRSMNEALDLKVSQLAEANVGLDESNRLKSEFVANVSHELRTPLNSIIGFAELLDELARSDPAADPKRLRYIGNILTSGRSLLEMINDLLSMAKLEAGRMEVNIEQVSVADVIEGLRTIMRPQAESRRIRIEPRLAPDLPVVETDPGKLQQILFNFLSNAIKFSPEGESIAVSAERVVRDDAAGGRDGGGSPAVRISVIDRGPGIPYDQQETIFRRFRQLDGSHTKKHAGTGLGLAICRELGELLGATVAVVSEPGRGATFSVELPLVYREKELQPLMA